MFRTLRNGLAVAAGLLLFAGCRTETEPAATPAPAPAPAATAGSYPLDTCPVSGEKLGAMGDPFVVHHEGTEVRLCCEGCLKEFRKDPAKYAAKVNAAK